MREDRFINGYVIYRLEDATIKRLALFLIGPPIFLPTHGFKDEGFDAGFQIRTPGPWAEGSCWSVRHLQGPERRSCRAGPQALSADLCRHPLPNR